jgi:stage III sporulation protein AG
MELLKKLFKMDKKDKDKEKEKGKDKGVLSWLILLAIGVLLVFFSSDMFALKQNNTKEKIVLNPDKVETQPDESYEATMEKKLQNILSKVSGAGQVEVMLTISYGKEIVIADDVSTDDNTSQEKDSTGGTRDSRTYKEEKKAIMQTPKSGITEPVVVKEKQPKIEGIIVVAQGGDDILVQSNLRKAASALFDVAEYKIEVFKMK